MALRSPIYKMVLIGEGGVGKTSITVRYTENRFDENMKMTIGVNFASKEVILEDGSVRLMLWDLGGQPRFRDVVAGYFKGSRVALAVYDANRYFSLERLTDWIDRVRENAPECQLIFVGNKIDERNDGSGVTLDEGREFASKYGAACVEVSAKTGEGISELFEVVARSLASEN
ncbi:MAG: Rab family GTPase [Candidatus Thorarchaeota archaeon]|jgi:small GTP-binding protein